MSELFKVVPPGRLELPHPKITDFESAASTNSATGAESITVSYINDYATASQRGQEPLKGLGALHPTFPSPQYHCPARSTFPFFTLGMKRGWSSRGLEGPTERDRIRNESDIPWLWRKMAPDTTASPIPIQFQGSGCFKTRGGDGLHVWEDVTRARNPDVLGNPRI